MQPIERKTGRLDYSRIFSPDSRPELDPDDPHIQLGLALRHIEGVADALAQVLQRDGLTGWKSGDAQHPFEFSFDNGVLGVYLQDKTTGSKDPRFFCYTSMTSGRREVYAVIINDPNSSQTEQLRSLPLLRTVTSPGFTDKKVVPISWSEITIESFGVGLSRGPCHIWSANRSRQSGEGVLFSEVSSIRLMVGGWWKNGKGSGEEKIAAYVADVVWDFDLDGFVPQHRMRSGAPRIQTEEDVYAVTLLGSEGDGQGLLDPVVAAFVAPAKAKNVPIVLSKTLEEMGRRGIDRPDARPSGRRPISLSILNKDK